MGRTANYPRDIFEQFDVELCDLEHKTQRLQLTKDNIFPVYDKHRLPMNLRQGEGFLCADTGEFCIRYGDSIYCMPKKAVGIGPLIYGMQQTSDVSWSTSTTGVWKIATCDTSGENVIYWSDQHHSASPVWSTDFTKIIYTEIDFNRFGSPHLTTKLCIINADGTGRTVIYDTGISWSLSGTRNYFRDYCMSPDGQKVALIDIDDNLRCVFADGSGDCGGGVLASGYGNPQWSDDSQTIYLTANVGGSNRGIVAIPFVGGTLSIIYNPNDLDYFWLSNDRTKFASAWYGGSSGFFTIINVNGTVEHAYNLSDIPWPTGFRDQPGEIFWAPDDSFLILTRQNRAATPNFTSTGVAVRTTPDLSDWQVFHWPTDSSDRGLSNWTLATVGGQMKLLGNAHSYPSDPSIEGSGIFQWDVETGAQEGWFITSPWNDPMWVNDRYMIGGLATCTGFFGTQVWDI